MGSVVDFLLKARRKVYRSGANPAGSSVPTSYDLEYREDEFYYRSTSLGGLYTATQERVWKNGKPVWAINIMGESADGFQQFLKRSPFANRSYLPVSRTPGIQTGGLCLFIPHRRGRKLVFGN